MIFYFSEADLCFYISLRINQPQKWKLYTYFKELLYWGSELTTETTQPTGTGQSSPAAQVWTLWEHKGQISLSALCDLSLLKKVVEYFQN